MNKLLTILSIIFLFSGCTSDEVKYKSNRLANKIKKMKKLITIDKDFVDTIDFKDYKDTDRYKLGTVQTGDDGSDIILFGFLFVWLLLILFASTIYLIYNFTK